MTCGFDCTRRKPEKGLTGRGAKASPKGAPEKAAGMKGLILENSTHALGFLPASHDCVFQHANQSVQTLYLFVLDVFHSFERNLQQSLRNARVIRIKATSFSNRLNQSRLHILAKASWCGQRI